MFKSWAVLTILTTATPLAAATVDVVLSPRLAQIAPAIDRVEARLEREFRATGNSAGNLRDLDSRTRLRRVAWAGQLIATPAEYGLVSFTRALATDALQRAGKPDARVRLTLTRLTVENHPVARVSGTSSFATGTAELLDAAGAVIKSVPVQSQARVHFTLGRPTADGDYQFEETDETGRIGPAVTNFVERALEGLYPGTDFPAPALVSRGLGTRIIPLRH